MPSPFEGLKYVPDEPAAGGAAAAAPSATPAPAAASPYAGLKYIEDAPAAPPAPPSTAVAAARGAVEGATLGWGDEIAAAADTLMSKIPGVRTVAQFASRNAGVPSIEDPTLTYAQRRDAYRAKNVEAKTAHPWAYGTGEIGGGLATAFIPELQLAKGAGALKVGAQGLALGGAAAAGESEGKTAGQVAKDTLPGAAIGGAGGALLHIVAGKAADLLATKIPELADKQAVKQLAREQPKSLTAPMTADPNLSAAINEPIAVGPKKAVTLAQIAGQPAEKVRPVLQAGQERIANGLEALHHTADAASGGGARLADIVGGYDSKIAEAAKSPTTRKFVNAMEGAREDALKAWGPTEEAIEKRQGELGRARDALYDKSHEASGGVELGDLTKRYDAEIATAKKTPGNEPVVAALEKARDSAINAWGVRKTFDPEALVDGGPFGGAKAGDAVAKLEKMAASRPTAAADLNAEAQRIRDAATKEGFDPTVRVPAKDIRAYATHLQNEAASDVADPKVAQRARQLLGSVTKDFVNEHVGNTLGPADRRALEALNKRTSNLYRWPDVLSGKLEDPETRDAVLHEFDQRVPHHALDEFAAAHEERGTQRIDKPSPGEASKAKEALGKATRDIANAHAAKALPGADVAEYNRLLAHRQSLKNIDAALARREMGEKGAKMGIGKILSHSVAVHQIAQAVPMALTGDIGGALSHVGGAVVAAGLPAAASRAGAAGRAIVRGAARGTDYLANTVAAAGAGNAWAQRQLNLLRSTPAGAARLAAAIARMHGAGAGVGEQ